MIEIKNRFYRNRFKFGNFLRFLVGKRNETNEKIDMFLRIFICKVKLMVKYQISKYMSCDVFNAILSLKALNRLNF